MSECKWKKPDEVDCVGYYLVRGDEECMGDSFVMGVLMDPSGALVSQKHSPISPMQTLRFFGPIPEPKP